jgi:hypothetical protein
MRKQSSNKRAKKIPAGADCAQGLRDVAAILRKTSDVLLSEIDDPVARKIAQWAARLAALAAEVDLYAEMRKAARAPVEAAEVAEVAGGAAKALAALWADMVSDLPPGAAGAVN